LLRLELLTDEQLTTVVNRALTAAYGLAEAFTLEESALTGLVNLASGDARRALTSLEAAAAIAQSQSRSVITVEDVESAVDRALLRYDRQGDEHYDVISAFIKSIRGSDPDAAIHYLARMIEAGEDPRFIARRLVISASEDIGLASPQALQIAVAAAEAVAQIGMPEGRIPLAEATIFLALAPKSNAAYNAINAAIADVRAGKSGPVPKHLRDGSYPGASRLGHGKGYQYAHDSEHGVVQQQYPPDVLVGTNYYAPTDRGFEADLAARLDNLRGIIRNLGV
jgi:putative ATPase